MQPKDYSVEEHLKKTSSHISILSLLMCSEAYTNCLIQVCRRSEHCEREHK